MYAARTRARRAFALWYRVYRTREAAPSGKSGTAPVPAAHGRSGQKTFAPALTAGRIMM